MITICTRPPGRALRLGAPGVAVLLALLLQPAAAVAQDGFLFRAPDVGITLRGGLMQYSAGSDVFEQLRRDLTLERRDFRSPALGAEFAIVAVPRVDFVVGVMYSQTERRSEFRDWVGDDGFPIEQVTTLRTVPVTATVRYLLAPRGRRISDMAWLPSSTTPYIGAGGGIAWYRLQQDGEFVDFEDFDIFYDVLETSGSTAMVHAVAGVDHWFMPRLGLNAEVRYSYGGARPNQSFQFFDRLDLGGAQATLGFSVRW
jgi:hypothetical protein